MNRDRGVTDKHTGLLTREVQVRILPVPLVLALVLVAVLGSGCEVEVSGLEPLADTVEDALCRTCAGACATSIQACLAQAYNAGYECSTGVSNACVYGYNQCQDSCDLLCPPPADADAGAKEDAK